MRIGPDFHAHCTLARGRGRPPRARRGAALTLACATWLPAIAAQSPDAELAACAERARPAYSMVQRQNVKVISDDGWTRKSSRMLYWKRFGADAAKMLFVVEQPESEAGLKVLVDRQGRRDPVIHVYTPDTRRARRLVGSGASNSVLGTDLTYEDALHFDRLFIASATRRLEDIEVDGRMTMVLETRPVDDRSAYSRIRTEVDKAWCLPLKAEFFGPNGSLDKTLESARDSVQLVNGYPVPMRSVMFNHKLRSRSEFLISEVEVDVELRDQLFSAAEIKKSH